MKSEASLSRVNFAFIQTIASLLQISTEFRFAEDFDLPEDTEDRLIALCKALECQTYVSGQAARAYIDENKFKRRGIGIEWFDYDGYPSYSQRSNAFTHQVSILDMMFSVGEKSPDYLCREMR